MHGQQSQSVVNMNKKWSNYTTGDQQRVIKSQRVVKLQDGYTV